MKIIQEHSNNLNHINSQISSMHIAPIGTIMAWSPVPDKNSPHPENIPQCWVACDGSIIKEGIWIGEKTPDINNQNRYISIKI